MSKITEDLKKSLSILSEEPGGWVAGADKSSARKVYSGREEAILKQVDALLSKFGLEVVFNRDDANDITFDVRKKIVVKGWR